MENVTTCIGVCLMILSLFMIVYVTNKLNTKP